MTTIEVLTDWDLDAWIATHLFAGAPVRTAFDMDGDVTVHLPFYLTGSGMLLVLEAMRERGYVAQGGGHAGAGWAWGFIPNTPPATFGYDGRGEADSLPRAVAEAAKAALEALT